MYSIFSIRSRSIVTNRLVTSTRISLTSKYSSIVTSTLTRAIATNSIQTTSFHVISSNVMNGTISKRYLSSSKELASILADEINAEGGDEEVDPDFLDVKKLIEENYKIVDKLGQSFVELVKTSGKEKVVVSFDCQDKDDIEPKFDENDNEELDENKEYDDSEFENESGVPFQVIIEKNGDKVVIDALAAQEMEVKNVQFIPAGKDSEDEKLYGGPIFDDLDDRLKEGVFKYLEELGVDNDMSYFILAYSAVKEQKEYVNWLKNVQKFTSS